MRRRWLAVSLFCALFSSSTTAVADQAIGGDFSLTDHNGEVFSLADMRGKVVLLFFGYTSCPDICPTELSNLARVLVRLQQHSDSVRVVFVTVDPERDTASVLKEYVGYFNEDLIGLRGSYAEITAVSKQYRARFSVEQHSDGSVSVSHPANLYVIDREGDLHSVVPYGIPVDHLVGVVQGLI